MAWFGERDINGRLFIRMAFFLLIEPYFQIFIEFLPGPVIMLECRVKFLFKTTLFRKICAR